VVFLHQAVWVFTVSLPVIFINAPVSADRRDYWTVMDIVGLTLFAIGLLCEAISDQTKFMFRNNPANKGKWCDTGIEKINLLPGYNCVRLENV
jgi:steroid 5-alpha reductase family enzyme